LARALPWPEPPTVHESLGSPLGDLVPFHEDGLAGDDDAAPLEAFREEREEHLHFVTALLDVADVVEDDDVLRSRPARIAASPT
jgi:hypothetical protein